MIKLSAQNNGTQTNKWTIRTPVGICHYRRLVFCFTFLDRALAAVSSGYQVTVVTRCREFSKQLQGSGLSFINIEFARRGLNPIREIYTILQLRKIFRQLQPHIVHNIALKPVVLGSIAAQLARVRNVVNALVGMGYVFTSAETQARLLRPLWIARFDTY